MAAIVAPGICRYSVHGTIHDRPWVNVLDMHIESGGIGTRDENVPDQARVLLNEYIDHIRPDMSSDWTLQGVRWVDLDTATGQTGERSDAEAPRTMPSVGQLGTSDAAPGCVAMMVRKVTGGGRGTRPGRIFLPGVSEVSFEGNTLSGAAVADWQANFDTFLDGISQSGATSFGGYDSHLVVVNTVNGAFVGHTDVSALAVQARAATQRRRLRG